MKFQTIGALVVTAALISPAAAFGQQSAPGTSGNSDYYGGYGGYGGYYTGNSRGSVGSQSTNCKGVQGFLGADVKQDGKALGLNFRRLEQHPVNVDVFQVSSGRKIVPERLVARFSKRTSSVKWDGKANRPGRKVKDGVYMVRYDMRKADGTRVDTLRVVLRRKGGKFSTRPLHYTRAVCDLIRSFKLERPVFGGPTARALRVAFQVQAPARVTVEVLRGKTLVATPLRSKLVESNGTQRLSMGAKDLSLAEYTVRLTVVRDGRTNVQTLTSARI